MRTKEKALARTLRREATSAEKALWARLRNRLLAGAKFRRQQCFGPYILDLYCAETKLCIEVDGGQHDLPDHRRHDAERTAFLEREGIRTVRFWNSQIRESVEWVVERIRLEMGKTPHPDPLPQGERE